MMFSGIKRSPLPIKMGVILLLTMFLVGSLFSIGSIGLILISASAGVPWIGTSGKTLWDWLDLLGTIAVPIVLAFIGVYFTKAENRRAQKLADQRSQDSSLQWYFSQMGALLIDKGLRTERDTTAVRNTAAAYTSAALEAVGPDYKRSILGFLYKANLIFKNKVVVSLGGTNLREAKLQGVGLCTRRGTVETLFRAEQEGVYPVELMRPTAEASLIGVDLRGATLSGADLGGCDLSFADLRGADLTDTKLDDACLIGAKVTDEQLRGCKSLANCTLPDETVHS